MLAGTVACAVAITACATSFEKAQKSGSIQSDTTPKIMVNRKWLGYANEISIQFSSSGEVFQTYFHYTAPKQPVGIIYFISMKQAKQATETNQVSVPCGAPAQAGQMVVRSESGRSGTWPGHSARSQNRLLK